ncbi:tigger transposable element-derived protein 6-like [Hydractinia symbiolongicarpus]|uniref:tigger transposable element-derived protein 6-like n=1 Tax=Hydractinia symbiolongicarpus TaxID=13093 RepID=UPI00254B3FC2|nr:tigger transposable element-derived protein 6-like [Hydractinia symbiolongicarpus]
MAMSKQQLAGKLAKKTLSLDDKIKFLDFAKKNPELGCRKLADIYKIGKTAAANILRDEKKIREQHEIFREKTKKRNRHGKYHKINEILFEWYKRCCASNIYPNGVMLKEEALEIKEKLQNSDFDNFSASDGWLDRWKTTYSVKERRIVGEAGDVSTETVTSWMERIKELVEGYSLENIWNMDESGCFFKALPAKGLVEKGKQAKGGKKSKLRLTVAFFVNAAGEKIDQPVVIWKSKVPRCFKKLKDPSRPANVHYFSNPKSWMTSQVMETVLARFNRKLLFEDRKVILFLDNATCHPESMIGQFSQIKIIFLPKNTTSRLQPLDAGIIKNFKVKYRKRLVKYVLARIQENKSATEIIKSVDILMAIQWVQDAWKEVTNLTIKNCFEKCGVVQGESELMEDKEDDLEFEALVKELTEDMSAAEYIDFDADVPASEPRINELEINWRHQIREASINAIENPEMACQVEEISEDDDESEDVVEEEMLGFTELITMLDKLSDLLFLMIHAKKCCQPLRKRLRNFSFKIENNPQSKIISNREKNVY